MWGYSRLGQITEIATHAGPAGLPVEKPRTLGHWAIIYLVAGSGSYHDARGADIPLIAGDVVLIIPGLAHSYGPAAGARWCDFSVFFRGPVFETWREVGIFDARMPVLHWLPPAMGMEALQDFLACLQKRPRPLMVELIARWQCILAKILRRTPRADPTRPEWFVRAVDLLERTGPADARELHAVAAACGMGYESFRKNFARLAGVSPGHYAQQRRIENARQLLSQGGHTNKEIAGRLGFHDEFHFARTFKKFTGRTPREESLWNYSR